MPLIALKSVGSQAYSTFPVRACPQPLYWLVLKVWLQPDVQDTICNLPSLIHARWFYWQPWDWNPTAPLLRGLPAFSVLCQQKSSCRERHSQSPLPPLAHSVWRTHLGSWFLCCLSSQMPAGAPQPEQLHGQTLSHPQVHGMCLELCVAGTANTAIAVTGVLKMEENSWKWLGLRRNNPCVRNLLWVSLRTCTCSAGKGQMMCFVY